MANYTALVNQWTTIPSSITLTADKLTYINNLTVTGSVPTSFYLNGNQILNCINWTEFAALTAQQQSNVLALCQIPGLILGGPANKSLLADGMILTYFSSVGPTLANLTALAQATIQPWWQANGYTSPINNNDLAAAVSSGLT